MLHGNLVGRLAVHTLIVLGALGLSGCATVYVDSALQDVSTAKIHKPKRLQDAQLMFTFQTKGATNGKATEILQSEVSQVVESSGLFAVVGPDPSLSGAILNITIDNVPITDQGDAAAKGFVTGLTFGLAGSLVTDGYVCTVDYLPPGSRQRVTKVARHALHTTMGAKGAPDNAIKAKNVEDGVRTMTRQVITQALTDLSQEPVFR